MPNLALPLPRRFTGLSAADRTLHRRTLLLDAALDLVGDEGWRAVTVRAVLERARLNPRYFYESFADLDELLVALYDQVVEQLGAVVLLALDRSGDAPAEKVRTVVDGVVGFVDEDPRRGRALYAEDLGHEALRRRRAETAGLVIKFVEDYAAQSRAPSDQADQVDRIATSVLVGGFNQLLVDWLAGRFRVTRDELVEDATALFLALGDASAAVSSARAEGKR